jgi:hypothetical protein
MLGRHISHGKFANEWIGVGCQSATPLGAVFGVTPPGLVAGDEPFRGIEQIATSSHDLTLYRNGRAPERAGGQPTWTLIVW